jgi:hypothetical protein
VIFSSVCLAYLRDIIPPPAFNLKRPAGRCSDYFF